METATGMYAARRHSEPPKAQKTIFEIIHEVAEKHGFTYCEMLAPRRYKALAHARQEAYWRCMKETMASLPAIARHFGGRDHSTILKGAKVYELRQSENKRGA